LTWVNQQRHFNDDACRIDHPAANQTCQGLKVFATDQIAPLMVGATGIEPEQPLPPGSGCTSLV
jgi:hypothetical protein